MAYKEDGITLSNLSDGQAVDKFNVELKKVLENINDPDATMAARSITLTVKFKPAKVGDTVAINIAAKSTLAPVTGIETYGVLSLGEDGEPIINEFEPAKQVEIGWDDRQQPEKKSPEEIAGEHENVESFPVSKEA